MPGEERDEVGLCAVEEACDEEGEACGQREKDDQKDGRQGSCEIATELAAEYNSYRLQRITHWSFSNRNISGLVRLLGAGNLAENVFEAWPVEADLFNVDLCALQLGSELGRLRRLAFGLDQ